jgi:DNA-directed RNA polymerase subunit RPC12/RpoP
MAQDWRVHALVYFCSAVDDLLGAVLYRHLDLEFADMKITKEMLDEAKLPDTPTARKVLAKMLEEDEAQQVQEPTCPECKAKVLYECVACSSNNYPPAAQPEERNFCPRCGKRTADLTTIHTCTPPQENT